MYAQRRPFDASGDALETFGEIQQVWHPWRRKYDLFMRSVACYQLGGRVLLTFYSLRKEGNEHSADEKETSDHHFTQLARIDEGLFSWHFVLRDRYGHEIGSVERGFRGWGREVC
jgi:hypothetical protein